MHLSIRLQEAHKLIKHPNELKGLGSDGRLRTEGPHRRVNRAGDQAKESCE